MPEGWQQPERDREQQNQHGREPEIQEGQADKRADAYQWSLHLPSTAALMPASGTEMIMESNNEVKASIKGVARSLHPISGC